MVVRIHPGQLLPVGLVLLVLLLTAACPIGASGQIATAPRDTSVIEADESDIVGTARAAQARFERRRIRYLPMSLGAPGGGRCDEHVGRFCEWYTEGEWYPVPEDPEIVTMRGAFLDQLVADPETAKLRPHTEYLREAGSEGIELVMWLIMRGAMSPAVEEIHRAHHVPTSNTSNGLIVLENA